MASIFLLGVAASLLICCKMPNEFHFTCFNHKIVIFLKPPFMTILWLVMPLFQHIASKNVHNNVFDSPQFDEIFVFYLPIFGVEFCGCNVGGLWERSEGTSFAVAS
jgi:hypothetical protein